MLTKFSAIEADDDYEVKENANTALRFRDVSLMLLLHGRIREWRRGARQRRCVVGLTAHRSRGGGTDGEDSAVSGGLIYAHCKCRLALRVGSSHVYLGQGGERRRFPLWKVALRVFAYALLSSIFECTRERDSLSVNPRIRLHYRTCRSLAKLSYFSFILIPLV